MPHSEGSPGDGPLPVSETCGLPTASSSLAPVQDKSPHSPKRQPRLSPPHPHPTQHLPPDYKPGYLLLSVHALSERPAFLSPTLPSARMQTGWRCWLLPRLGQLTGLLLTLITQEFLSPAGLLHDFLMALEAGRLRRGCQHGPVPVRAPFWAADS